MQMVEDVQVANYIS